MENIVIGTILDRSSIRAYTDEMLTEAELSVLKKAALSSPTAMNRQDQRFAFITRKETIDEIEKAVVDTIVAGGDADFAERIKSRGGKVMYDAPLVVVIFAKPAKFAGVDAGIAVENLAIAAKSMGLDSVILGMPDAAFAGQAGAERRAALGIDEEFEFKIAIAIGHRATEKLPHEWDESHIIDIK
ncbi:MAG: nitroreductase family protein [Christensenellaceae bacterium]|nr:nitroreductase family protein [Christensenellaceae bacterium]